MNNKFEIKKINGVDTLYVNGEKIIVSTKTRYTCSILPYGDYSSLEEIGKVLTN